MQELSDDYEDGQDQSQAAGSRTPSSQYGPALPPQKMEEKQSVDDLVRDLKRSPFFMTSLEDADDGENPELDAIRALIYEGSRAEIASNFREQGNEEARVKRWKEAKDFYTKGLAALKVERKTEDPVGEGEDDKEAVVKELLLTNRALCQLEIRTYFHGSPRQVHTTFITFIENYRSCTLDCMAALAINARNVKAHYRMANALFSLNKLSEAESACNAGLLVDPSNVPLDTLSHKIKSKQKLQDEKDKRMCQEEENKGKVEAMVTIALKARQITTRNTGQPPEMKEAAIMLTPDPLSPTSTLVFPVVVLYPLHLQSDFIKSFGEQETLQAHLEYLLPLPWDKLGEYKAKTSEAYLETVEGGLIKWGKKVELLKVLSGSKVEIVDGLVKVNILPKNRASEWIDTVKKRNAK